MGQDIRSDTPVFLNSGFILPDGILSREGCPHEGLVLKERIGIFVSLEFNLEVRGVHRQSHGVAGIVRLEYGEIVAGANREGRTVPPGGGGEGVTMDVVNRAGVVRLP